MLHVQKCSSDRSSLGFDKTASLSSNHAYTSKTVFVKPMKVKESSSEGKQVVASTLPCKKISIEPHISYLKPRVMHPPRKLSYQRFVPKCHHCGKGGNIRSHYFNLKPHMHINENSYSKKESEEKCYLG
jgi:hypothetical protein